VDIKTRKDLTHALRTLRIGPDHPKRFCNFTSYGSYTVVFVCHDAEMAHPQCVADNLKDALSRNAGDRFVACNRYDEGPTESCLYCEQPIESSYGDPEGAE
jgi:hypothetical protein